MLPTIIEQFGKWLSANAGALQAFAAIIALGLSIYVPYRLDAKARRRSDDERRIQARALAVAVEPELLEIQRSVQAASTTWSPAGLNPHLDIVNVQNLDVPPTFDKSIERLYLLGEPASTTLIRLLSLLWQYNRVIDVLRDELASGQRVDKAEVFGIKGRLEQIDGLLKKGIEDLDPIHGNNKPAQDGT